jgi:hypothetical protein
VNDDADGRQPENPFTEGAEGSTDGGPPVWWRRPVKRLLWAWNPTRPRRLTLGFVWVGAGFLALATLGALPVLFRVGGPTVSTVSFAALVTAMPAAAMLGGALVTDARALGHTAGSTPRISYLAGPSLLLWWLGLALTLGLPADGGRLSTVVLLGYPITIVWLHLSRRPRGSDNSP